MRRLKTTAILLFLLLPSIILAWRSRDLAHLGTFGDDGIYVVTAKALADGEGYRIVSLPGEPRQQKYPILYPLVLSLFWRIAPGFPANLPWIAAASWAFLPVLLLICRLMCRDYGLSGWRAWLLCAAVALNPIVLVLTVMPMSEIMFSCLLIVCLMLTFRAAQNTVAVRFALLAGLAAAAAYLTRTAGVCLLIVGPGCFLLRRQYRSAVAFLAGMAPAVLGWTLWSRGAVSAFEDYSRAYYFDYVGVIKANLTWSTAPEIVFTNMARLFQALGGLLLMMPDESQYLRGVGILVLVGFLLWWERSGVTPYNLFVAVYCLMLLLQPYTPDERFLTPVLPLLFASLLAIPSPRFAAPVVASGLAFLCLFGVAGPVYAASHVEALQRRGRELQQAYEWIRHTLPENARFISAYDTPIFLYTGRQGTAYRFPTRLTYRSDMAGIRRNLEGLACYARVHKLDYVLITSEQSVSLLNERENALATEIVRDQFDPVFHAASASIFRRKPS